MKKIIDLPMIICGQCREIKDDYSTFEYSNDVIVRIPKLKKEDAIEILSNDVRLEDIPLYEITRYLANFSSMVSDPNSKILEEAVNNTALVTGYSKENIYRDYYIICGLLSFRNATYDLMDAELGNYRLIDEWVRTQSVEIRAYPRGRAFHICVGNVPLATMYTVYRSIITKNQTVIKLPSRDLVTGIFFVKALIDANGTDHPISRALSAIYMDYESDIFKLILKNSDVVCAWGKGASLKKIKEQVPHSIPYLEYGPKRSYSYMDLTEEDYDKAALRLAHDMSIYDQEACFSPQRLFFKGNADKFIVYLKKWLNWQEEHIPKGIVNSDASSHLLRSKMEALYRNWKIESNGNKWTIIRCNPYEVNEHPLGRTIFIHEINDIKEMLPFLDDEVQTVSMYPYDGKKTKAEVNFLCSNGVSRVCETGAAVYPQDGFTWDALRALPYFVRFCCKDENINFVGKYGSRAGREDYLATVYGARFAPPEEKKELVDLWLEKGINW